jgi:hypothetical protein
VGFELRLNHCVFTSREYPAATLGTHVIRRWTVVTLVFRGVDSWIDGIMKFAMPAIVTNAQRTVKHRRNRCEEIAQHASSDTAAAITPTVRPGILATSSFFENGPTSVRSEGSGI